MYFLVSLFFHAAVLALPLQNSPPGHEGGKQSLYFSLGKLSAPKDEPQAGTVDPALEKTTASKTMKKIAEKSAEAPDIHSVSPTDISSEENTENRAEDGGKQAAGHDLNQDPGNTSKTAQTGTGNASQGPVKTGFGWENGPRFAEAVLPEYPPRALHLGKEGTVLLTVHLDEEGNLLKVDVEKKAGFGFDEAAMDAVRASSFVPAHEEGRPVACVASLPIRFVLENKP